MALDNWFQQGEQYEDANNFEQALEYYSKAAEAGHAAACKKIGKFYQEGKGVIPSATEAVKWYEKAGREGYVELGYCHQHGYGVPRNEQKAREYFQRASRYGERWL